MDLMPHGTTVAALVAKEAQAVGTQLMESLQDLTKLAPEIARVKAVQSSDQVLGQAEYESKPERPHVVVGRPSEALAECARLFPDLVSLGGCAA